MWSSYASVRGAKNVPRVGIAECHVSGQFGLESVYREIFGRNQSIFLCFKCNWLHVVIYSIDSSKMMGNFPEVLNFNWVFSKLNRFICS